MMAILSFIASMWIVYNDDLPRQTEIIAQVSEATPIPPTWAVFLVGALLALASLVFVAFEHYRDKESNKEQINTLISVVSDSFTAVRDMIPPSVAKEFIQYGMEHGEKRYAQARDFTDSTPNQIDDMLLKLIVEKSKLTKQEVMNLFADSELDTSKQVQTVPRTQIGESEHSLVENMDSAIFHAGDAVEGTPSDAKVDDANRATDS